MLVESFESERTGLLLLRRALRIPTGGDGLAEAVVERLFRTEETGHEEVEEAPQLEDVVLDGSTGEDETMDGSKRLDSLGELRLPVLDDVTFVKDAVVPIDLAEPLGVVASDVVGRDDAVVLGDGTNNALALDARTGVDECANILRVGVDLVLPVTGEGRRADDKGREVHRIGRTSRLVTLRSFVVHAREDSDRLERLSETHVWGG